MTSYTDREGQELHIGDVIIYIATIPYKENIIVGLKDGFVFVPRGNAIVAIRPHFVAKVEPVENVVKDVRGHQLFKGDKVFFAYGNNKLYEGTVVATGVANGVPMVLVDEGGDYPVCCRADGTVCVDVGR